jgi:hypothetical protein
LQPSPEDSAPFPDDDEARAEAPQQTDIDAIWRYVPATMRVYAPTPKDDRMTPNHEPKVSTRADGSSTLEARGYSWPDAEPGNVIALKHGAESPRVTDAVAEIIADAVLAEAQRLEAEIFQGAIWRYARAEARARLLSNYILSVAEEHPEKVGSRLWESANGADNAASKTAEALGLTPLSRAKLAALVTSTEATSEGLAQPADKGRAIRERAQAALKDAEMAVDEVS